MAEPLNKQMCVNCPRCGFDCEANEVYFYGMCLKCDELTFEKSEEDLQEKLEREFERGEEVD